MPPDRATELVVLLQHPEPYVRVEQQLHRREAFQPSNAPIGPTISSETSILSLMHPSQDPLVAARAGTTSATGFPKRVTRTGLRVRLTSSITARHVALNFEIAISRILLRKPEPSERGDGLVVVELGQRSRFAAVFDR